MSKKYTYVCRNRYGDEPCEIGGQTAPNNQVELDESEVPPLPAKPSCKKCGEDLHGPVSIAGGGGGSKTILKISVVAISLVLIAFLIKAIIGGGAPSQISGLPRSVNFDVAEIGSEVEQQINVVNDGEGMLKIKSLTFSADAFSSPAQELAIPPGESTAIRLLFKPPTEGDFTGELKVSNNDPEFPEVVINLIGKGGTRDPWSVLSELEKTSTILKP